MARDTDINPDFSSCGRTPIRQWNSIGFKIMLANMLALLVLGFGVVMFSEYRRAIVYTELSLLKDEATLWSVYLAEGGLLPSDPAFGERVLRLNALARRDIMVFDAQGQVWFRHDGSLIMQKNESPLREDHPTSGVTTRLAQFLLMLFPVRYDLPLYQGGEGVINADSMIEMENINGISMNAWKNAQDELIFTASIPVSFVNGETGTLLIVKNTTETDEAFQMVRLDVVRILLAALAITLALTVYVAFMVARPLNRLAIAAEDIGRSGGEIPDLSVRGDEIGALSAVLRRTTSALRDRLDAIERFAADVSHELKNPLTSLRSAIETLPRLSDESKRDRLMKIMNEDTCRLDRLITDISGLSRLDSELARQKTESIDLEDAILQVLRGYAPSELFLSEQTVRPLRIVTDADVTVTLDLPSTVPKIQGYAGRLEQVFGNLVGNALSFSPVSGTVSICVRVFPESVRIIIDDEGPGIPEGKFEAIFTRFYTERPESEGFGMHSGLGLSIARQIVESIGGRIWAENRKDPATDRILGARFVVELQIFVLNE